MASPSRLSRLPLWLSRWFGYRTATPKRIPEYSHAFWSFVGAFGGISILAAVFGYTQYFTDRRVPEVVASFVSHSSRPFIIPGVLFEDISG